MQCHITHIHIRNLGVLHIKPQITTLFPNVIDLYLMTYSKTTQSKNDKRAIVRYVALYIIIKTLSIVIL